MSTILIIDDDRDFSRSLQIQLEMAEHTVTTAHTGDAGLQAAAAAAFDLILLDLKLRETDGLAILDRLRAAGVDAPVVMITGEQDMQANIEAIRQGVLDYLRKPFDLQAVLDIVDGLQQSDRDDRGTADVIPLRQVSTNPREIVGAAPGILELLKQIGLLSRSPVSVLIEGESGSGKEVVARALHQTACPDQPFMAINCTAVVPTLLESELFGHLKGAFTGATQNKTGMLELAGDGTLFLDEIGDMPRELQPKLLRVIQEREFTPVGGGGARPFRARIVAATNRDLEHMVETGDFREDLFYRLAVTRLCVPALRTRKSDIELLTMHLLWRITRELHQPIAGISRGAMQCLYAYDWPGNVRELENVLTRAVALSKGTVLQDQDLKISDAPAAALAPLSDSQILPLAEVEKRHVLASLDACDWNITHTADRLGISRPTLRKKIEDYGLTPRDDT